MNCFLFLFLKQFIYFRLMSEMTIATLELRIAAVEASYERQLNLSGKAGYDHSLTIAIKNDLDWLHAQKEQVLSQITADKV